MQAPLAADNSSISAQTAGQWLQVAGATVPVFRHLGHNPGPMTGPGTNSYLLGKHKRCLIDPGPASEQQIASLLAGCAGELDMILVTHTHRDHSPAAQRLKEITGAELIGAAVPEAAGQDSSFVPDRLCTPGLQLQGDDFTLECIATPGHVSNHYCFLLREEGGLFTGDHVLQGTTPVILPPDGDMSAYLRSLEELAQRELNFLAPGHGGIMRDPRAEISALIAHRLRREQSIVDALQAAAAMTVQELVAIVYDGLAEHLLPWAEKTLLAHLIKLQHEQRVQVRGEQWSLV